MTSEGGIFEVWVFLDREDLAVESVISSLEREYLNATEGSGFDLHVIPLDQVDEDALPPIQIVLER